MKIFSRDQIYNADQLTIERQHLELGELMERAAEASFNYIHSRLQGSPTPIVVIAGTGNNGGDGLALARHLVEHGYHVQVYLVTVSNTRSPEFLQNLERLKDRKCWPELLEEKGARPELTPQHILVDAIFGIGLNRVPDLWILELFAYINASPAFVVSLDIASGVFLDEATVPGQAIEAEVVLSFQFPKLPFFLPETAGFIHGWEVVDIGLDPEVVAQTQTDYLWIYGDLLEQAYKPRGRFAHKGELGHVAIIGGSTGKMGAVRLAAEAALSSGAGKVSARVPQSGLLPLQIGLPEAMVETGKGKDVLESFSLSFEAQAAAIGMGMGTDEKSLKALSAFLAQKELPPLVLDADALNLLAANPELLKQLPPDSILLPHPGELKRLVGEWSDDFDKLKKARAFAKKHNCLLVVKGANTLTVYQGVGYFNSSGNPGMATAGSGDVLSGIVAGLLAQGYTPLNAALVGVFIHGLSGDLAVRDMGFEALKASHLIQYLGVAFRQWLQPPAPPEQQQEA